VVEILLLRLRNLKAQVKYLSFFFIANKAVFVYCRLFFRLDFQKISDKNKKREPPVIDPSPKSLGEGLTNIWL